MSKTGEYRFALYGRTESGKTCMLATIEMGAIGHSHGLTCVALPVQVAKPTGDQNTWGIAELEAASLHAGKEWIAAAENKLRHRERPDANPPGGIALAYRFIVGSPGRGNSVIRTIDYAGELVNPDGLKEPQSLAARLKRDLENYDGFLLVAETPPLDVSDGDLSDLNDELTRLQQSFAALSESKFKLRTPVAVLLTKWDRFSAVERNEPEQELGKLEAFRIDPRFAGYASLVDSISTALAPQHEIKNGVPVFGLPFGNCAMFAATAFGQTDQSTGNDQPPSECRPFGVLEPFVWLANRRDQLDAEHLEQDWSSLRWEFWNPQAVGRVLWDSVRSARRIPHKQGNPSELFQRVRRVKLKAFSLMAGVVSAWCCILFLTVGLAIGLSNRMAFQGQESIMANTQAPDEQLTQARTWFDGYRLRWHGLFLAPTSADALNNRDLIDDALDDRYWSPVSSSTDDAEKSEHASDYLRRLANGSHATEARQIVEAWNAELARREDTAWLAERVRQVENATKADTVEVWESTVADCQCPFPRPAAVTTEQNEQRQSLVDRAARMLVAAEERRRKENEKLRWESFKKSYLSLLNSNSYKDAVDHLMKPESRSEDWQKLVREFSTELHKRVNGQVEASMKVNQFDTARKQLKSAEIASESLELVLRESLPDLAKAILSGHSKNLTPIKTRIDTSEDKQLYSNVLKHRDEPSCDEYLAGSRPKSMNAEVEKYKSYQHKRKGPLDLTVSIFVTWDAGYNLGHHNIVTVNANGTVAYKTPAYVNDSPGETSGVIGTFTLNKMKLASAVKFSASIVEEDTFDNDDGGIGTATFTVDELIQQQRSFPLRPADGSALTNTMILKVTGGLESEPTLPTWRQP